MGKHTQQPNFKVFVMGHSTSLEDWKRSLNAPTTELPELTAEQKAFAKRFGITDEEYARSRLSLEYGQERTQRRGVELGRAVEEILGGFGDGYELKAAILESMKERWVLRIQTPKKVINVAVDRELADDIVDSYTIQDLERLRELLETSFEQSERIGKK